MIVRCANKYILIWFNARHTYTTRLCGNWSRFFAGNRFISFRTFCCRDWLFLFISKFPIKITFHITQTNLVDGCYHFRKCIKFGIGKRHWWVAFQLIRSTGRLVYNEQCVSSISLIYGTRVSHSLILSMSPAHSMCDQSADSIVLCQLRAARVCSQNTALNRARLHGRHVQFNLFRIYYLLVYKSILKICAVARRHTSSSRSFR